MKNTQLPKLINFIKSTGIVASIFCLILITFNFYSSRSIVAVSSQEKSNKPEIIEIVAETKEDYTADNISKDLEGLDYQRVTLKSNFAIGDQTQTDYVIKTKGEDLTEIEREIDNG